MIEKEIVFIGRITAGVTHEVNNVLASIREISGLLSDILSITSEESFPRKEKFETSISKIQNQEKRGVKLINQLNKFAHLPDSSSAEVDLIEFIENLVFLTERFGRIKNIQLQIKSSTESLKIVTNPFYLQMALYNCIEYFLNRLGDGGKIVLEAEKNEKFYLALVYPEGEINDKTELFNNYDSEELKTLRDLSKILNADLEFDDSKMSITIKLPQGQ